MGAFAIELADESVEAVLLLEAVCAGRSCGLGLERPVHALVSAVLLRAAGLDAFDGDAEPQPPDRQPGEVVEAVGRGERRMAVGRPRCLNSRTKASMTGISFVDSSASQARMKREA